MVAVCLLMRTVSFGRDVPSSRGKASSSIIATLHVGAGTDFLTASHMGDGLSKIDAACWRLYFSRCSPFGSYIFSLDLDAHILQVCFHLSLHCMVNMFSLKV